MEWEFTKVGRVVKWGMSYVPVAGQEEKERSASHNSWQPGGAEQLPCFCFSFCLGDLGVAILFLPFFWNLEIE